MDELTILLVEDETDSCAKFDEYIKTIDNVSLIYATNNAFQALDNISFYRPDVVILDLELHRGCGNGLDVLSGLQKLEVKPYVIVTTNNSSSTTYECARELGADYIMYKHQDNYSEKYVIDFLIMLKKGIKKRNTETNWQKDISPSQQEEKKKQLITNELFALGFTPNRVGFKYLVDGIFLAMNGSTSKLYDEIAHKYKKTSASVERAMQNAIDRIWQTTDVDTLLESYTVPLPIHRGSPTLSGFVSYYATKIAKRAK